MDAGKNRPERLENDRRAESVFLNSRRSARERADQSFQKVKSDHFTFVWRIIVECFDNGVFFRFNPASR